MEEVERLRLDIIEQEGGSYIVHAHHFDPFLKNGFAHNPAKTYAFTNKADLVRWLLHEFGMAHLKHKDTLFPKVQPLVDPLDGFTVKADPNMIFTNDVAQAATHADNALDTFL